MSSPYFEVRFPEYEQTEMSIIGPLIMSGVSDRDLERAYDLFETGFVDLVSTTQDERKDARAELVGAGYKDSSGRTHFSGFLDDLNATYDTNITFDWVRWREEYGV